MYTRGSDINCCEWPSGLNVTPIPGLISYTGVTGSVSITYHTHESKLTELPTYIHIHTCTCRSYTTTIMFEPLVPVVFVSDKYKSKCCISRKVFKKHTL